ncbi:MAG: glycerophosphodiester phosphodiesterase [Thermodesulfobacteriota bacterium]|nr:glycerophosphodiester phosphodiesterase [Thermodesulfobacteriota bacterium]
MSTLYSLEKPFLWTIDCIYKRLPQKHPDKKRLYDCKIISHRGEHDNINVLENTLAAFDRIREKGIWGIELDIRWTKDLIPVVFHDYNLKRLFKSDLELGKITQHELKTKFPAVPSLAEVITRYGGKLHLMVEIKEEVYSDPVYQNSVLQDLFSSLEPEKDFHFISLSPDMFKLIDFVPAATFLPIAQLNVRQLSEIALQQNYGGLLAHYLFLTKSYVKKHRIQNQQVGTAYIKSKNSLFRELNRGVEWVFSNNAIQIQSIRNACLRSQSEAV